MRQTYLVLAMNFVRHGQLLAALCAAGSQYAASVGRLHALTETMFVVSFAVVGLECSFHFVYAVFFVLFPWRFGLKVPAAVCVFGSCVL